MIFFSLRDLIIRKVSIQRKAEFQETDALEPATKTEEIPFLYCSLKQNIGESRKTIGQLSSSWESSNRIALCNLERPQQKPKGADQNQLQWKTTLGIDKYLAVWQKLCLTTQFF